MTVCSVCGAASLTTVPNGSNLICAGAWKASRYLIACSFARRVEDGEEVESTNKVARRRRKRVRARAKAMKQRRRGVAKVAGRGGGGEGEEEGDNKAASSSHPSPLNSEYWSRGEPLRGISGKAMDGGRTEGTARRSSAARALRTVESRVNAKERKTRAANLLRPSKTTGAEFRIHCSLDPKVCL